MKRLIPTLAALFLLAVAAQAASVTRISGDVSGTVTNMYPPYNTHQLSADLDVTQNGSGKPLWTFHATLPLGSGTLTLVHKNANSLYGYGWQTGPGGTAGGASGYVEDTGSPQRDLRAVVTVAMPNVYKDGRPTGLVIRVFERFGGPGSDWFEVGAPGWACYLGTYSGGTWTPTGAGFIVNPAP